MPPPVENSIEQQVKQIIKEKLGQEEYQLQPDASLSDDLGIDLLDVFELLITIENTFHINIPGDEMEKIKTRGSLIEYVQRQTTW